MFGIRKLKLEYHDYFSLNLYLIGGYLSQIHNRPKTSTSTKLIRKAAKSLEALQNCLDELMFYEYPGRGGYLMPKNKLMPHEIEDYYYSTKNRDLSEKILHEIALSKEPFRNLTNSECDDFYKDIETIPIDTLRNRELSDVYTRILNLIPADDKTGLKEKIQTELEIINERFAKYKLLLDL